MSQYVFDFSKLMIPGGAYIIICYILNLGIDYVWLITILSILSMLPLIYLLSLIFNSDMTTRNLVRFGVILLGGVLAITFFIF